METASRFVETAEERAELRHVAAAVQEAKRASAAAEVIWDLPVADGCSPANSASKPKPRDTSEAPET